MDGWLWLTPVIAALGGWVAGMIIKKKILQTLSRMVAAFTESLRTAIRPHPAGQAGIEGSHYQQIRPFIEEQADHFFRYRLVQAMPMVGMLIGDKTIQQMKAVLMNELEDLFPVVMEKYFSVMTDPPVNTTPSSISASSSASADHRPDKTAPSPPGAFPFGPHSAGNLDRYFRHLPAWGLLIGLVVGGLQLLYIAFVVG